MTEDEIYQNLPDDPHLAFVHLEQFYRGKYEEMASELDNGNAINFQQMTYLNKVIAAAKIFEIPAIQDYELPENDRNLWEFANVFTRDIESLIVQIRISSNKKFKQFSVALSPTEKAKARHFIDQLDILVDSSDCEQDKKQAIKNKLKELRAEIDADRTRFDRITDKIRSIARLSGDVEREGAEPWWKWVKALLGVVDESKEKESQTSLPSTFEKKRLEPPRKQLPSFSRTRDLDDEVPF
jgi:hypothetical protein